LKVEAKALVYGWERTTNRRVLGMAYKIEFADAS